PRLAHARLGGRERAARPDPLRPAPLRSPGLRLLAAAPRPTQPPRPLPGRLDPRRADRRRGDDADDPGLARGVPAGARRLGGARHAPLGGHLRPDPGPAAPRRPRPRPRPDLGRGRLLGPRQRARLRLRRARRGRDPRSQLAPARAARPGAVLVLGALLRRAASLEGNARQVELVPPLERCERDREILKGETGRVEGGDLLGGGAARRRAGEDVAGGGNTLAAGRPRLDRRRALAAVARLLPVVAEDVRAGELLDGDLGLAGPV